MDCLRTQSNTHQNSTPEVRCAYRCEPSEAFTGLGVFPLCNGNALIATIGARSPIFGLNCNSEQIRMRSQIEMFELKSVKTLRRSVDDVGNQHKQVE